MKVVAFQLPVSILVWRVGRHLRLERTPAGSAANGLSIKFRKLIDNRQMFCRIKDITPAENVAASASLLEVGVGALHVANNSAQGPSSITMLSRCVGFLRLDLSLLSKGRRLILLAPLDQLWGTTDIS